MTKIAFPIYIVLQKGAELRNILVKMIDTMRLFSLTQPADRAFFTTKEDRNYYLQLSDVIIKLEKGGNGCISVFSANFEKEFVLIPVSGESPIYKNGLVAVSLDNDRFLILGGFSEKSQGIDPWVFSLKAKQWKKIICLSPILYQIAFSAGVFVRNLNSSVIYLFGGADFDGLISDLFIMFFEDNYLTVSRVEYPQTSSPVARRNHTLTNHQGRIFLFGGFDQSFNVLDDFWELEYTNCHFHPSWRHIRDLGPLARHSHVSYSNGVNLCIAGGIGEEGYLFNDIWNYTNSWKKQTFFELSNPYFGSSLGLCEENKKACKVKFINTPSRFMDKIALIKKSQEYFNNEYQSLQLISSEIETEILNSKLEPDSKGVISKDKAAILSKSTQDLRNKFLDVSIALAKNQIDNINNKCIKTNFYQTYQDKVQNMVYNLKSRIGTLQQSIANDKVFFANTHGTLEQPYNNSSMLSPSDFEQYQQFLFKMRLYDQKKRFVSDNQNSLKASSEKSFNQNEIVSSLVSYIDECNTLIYQEDAKMDLWNTKLINNKALIEASSLIGKSEKEISKIKEKQIAQLAALAKKTEAMWKNKTSRIEEALNVAKNMSQKSSIPEIKVEITNLLEEIYKDPQ